MKLKVSCFKLSRTLVVNEKFVQNLAYHVTLLFLGRYESCRLDGFLPDAGDVRRDACAFDFRKYETWWP